MGHRRDLPGPVPGAVDADLGQQLAEPDRLAQRPDDHQAAHDQGRRGQQGHDPARGGTRATLAGTAPYLRDGGGNVITVSRQSLGASDDNENFLDLSGVTIESPDIAAEAGVAFFNTSGRIANSVIGTIKPTAAYGYGL